MAHPSFDPGPVLARFGPDARDAEIAEACGVTRHAVAKWRHHGRMSQWTADRVAVALGLHPCLLWGDEWWESALRVRGMWRKRKAAA